MKKTCLVIATALIAACSDNVTIQTTASDDAQGHSAPTKATITQNKALLEQLPFHDQTDFEQANKGFIASLKNKHIADNNGGPLWDMSQYDFMATSSAPDSVNPSLWRQATLNNIDGLFEVTKGIYQLRGFDLANMTLIQGESGWIVVDPLTAEETARSAINFARQHLGEQSISAIIFTHSHIDHFGGIGGVLSAEQIENSDVPIIAPEGFIEEATSENVIAGTAMSRRAMFMYGKRLARSERGHIGSGLGKGPAFGTFSIAEPNIVVDASTRNMTIDGIEFEFQYVPESEAPAELVFYLPKFKAFCGAELVSRNMHNLYTLRGAKVRDAIQWSAYIEQARDQFSDADIYFGSHHWPIWGQENIHTFLTQQRDTYKFIHDQTVRLLNAGHTPDEIAEQLELPEALAQNFSNRGYYGTVKHNARAVYQNYLGWYDANPANLDPIPTKARAERFVALAGGIEALVANAQASFAKAESDPLAYRWVAEMLNNAVIAEPNHSGAATLLAKTYDQLGYQAESGPWRDVYLSAAYELRHGAPAAGIDLKKMRGLLIATPPERFFDTMSIRLNADKAKGKDYQVKITFTDKQQSHLLQLSNSVMHHAAVADNTKAPVTLNISHGLFIDLIIGNAGLKDVIFSDDLNVDGSRLELLAFLRLFDQPQGDFPIVHRE